MKNNRVWHLVNISVSVRPEAMATGHTSAGIEQRGQVWLWRGLIVCGRHSR